MLIRLCAFVLLIFVSAPSFAMFVGIPAGQKSFPYHKKKDLNKWGLKGEAILSVTPLVVERGKEFEIQLTFINRSGRGEYFFNPCFVPLTYQPAALIIYDASKNCLGDLLYRSGGSFGGLVRYLWGFHFDGSCAGTVFRMKLGELYGEENSKMEMFGVFKKWLPPGAYYVQAVYHSIFLIHPLPVKYHSESEAFLFGPSFEAHEEGEDFDRAEKAFRERWNKTPKDDDLFRSNVVKFELIDPKESEARE